MTNLVGSQDYFFHLLLFVQKRVSSLIWLLATVEPAILFKWNYGQLRWVFVVITPQPEKNNVESTSQRLQKESNEQCLHLGRSRTFFSRSVPTEIWGGVHFHSPISTLDPPPPRNGWVSPWKGIKPKKIFFQSWLFKVLCLSSGAEGCSESKSNTNDSHGKNRTWKGFWVDLIGHNTWTQTNSFKRVHNLFGRHHLEKKTSAYQK